MFNKKQNYDLEQWSLHFQSREAAEAWVHNNTVVPVLSPFAAMEEFANGQDVQKGGSEHIKDLEANLKDYRKRVHCARCLPQSLFVCAPLPRIHAPFRHRAGRMPAVARSVSLFSACPSPIATGLPYRRHVTPTGNRCKRETKLAVNQPIFQTHTLTDGH